MRINFPATYRDTRFLSVLCLLAPLTLSASAVGQTYTFKVSGAYDATSAPSSGPLPGLRGRFRQQILIAESRLAGLKGKTITGFWVRRELHFGRKLTGGRINLSVSLSVATRLPRAASEMFALNAPAKQQLTTFSGNLTVPNSPALGTNPLPWSAANSFKVMFSSPFKYTGGTLVLDLAATPQKSGAPSFWYVAHEYIAHNGTATAFGQSCSPYIASGLSITAESKGLQIGGTARIVVFGRPGASPLLLIGVSQIQAGLDLTPIGATGCRQYVNYLTIVRMKYQAVVPNFSAAFTNLFVQVPPDSNLIGSVVYLQSADIETSLPRSQWTNTAGLTTSNGLKIRISTAAPTLGLSIVQSREVASGKPLPASGRVDVGRGPIIRLLFK